MVVARRREGKVAVDRERRDWAAGSAKDSAQGEEGGGEPSGGRQLLTGVTEEGVAESVVGGGVAGGGGEDGGMADHRWFSSCLTEVGWSSSSLEGMGKGDRNSLVVGVVGLVGALLLLEVVLLTSPLFSPSSMLVLVVLNMSSVSLLLGTPGFSPRNLGVLRTGTRTSALGAMEDLRDNGGLEEISFPLILS